MYLNSVCMNIIGFIDSEMCIKEIYFVSYEKLKTGILPFSFRNNIDNFLDIYAENKFKEKTK